MSSPLHHLILIALLALSATALGQTDHDHDDDMHDFSGIAIEDDDHRHGHDDDHGHDHDDDHRHGHDDDHGHDHDDDHGGHDDDHGHGHDEATVVVTHFTEVSELFVEFPALVMGQASPFAAHLTRLDSYTPVASGTVTVTLSGGGAPDEQFSVATPSIPGIFRPIALPQHPVQRHVTVRLQGEGLDTLHDLGTFTVFPSQALALAGQDEEEHHDDTIAFLKEQQWQVDFALSEATQRPLRASVRATGTLRARADGEAYLSATTTGHLATAKAFPYPGMAIKRGQLLATISPQLGTASDLAAVQASLDKAHSEYQLAIHERERLEKLWALKAIAEHRLHEAQSAEEVAKAEFDAAERRYTQARGGKQPGSGVPVLAPIGGVLAQVQTAPGRYVNEGEPLFHIVNLDRLWLESRIAEVDVGRLSQANGAWFTVEGFDQTFNTFELNGRGIALGGVVDPVNRTVPLILEFDNPGQALRVGMFANVRVFTGETRDAVSVPTSAIYDDGGQEVVYVMLGGESFERRIVQPGLRDGGHVEIKSGLEPGERVVSRGAYFVRLASASPAEAGHGHAH